MEKSRINLKTRSFSNVKRQKPYKMGLKKFLLNQFSYLETFHITIAVLETESETSPLRHLNPFHANVSFCSSFKTAD